MLGKVLSFRLEKNSNRRGYRAAEQRVNTYYPETSGEHGRAEFFVECRSRTGAPSSSEHPSSGHLNHARRIWVVTSHQRYLHAFQSLYSSLQRHAWRAQVVETQKITEGNISSTSGIAVVDWVTEWLSEYRTSSLFPRDQPLPLSTWLTYPRRNDNDSLAEEMWRAWNGRIRQGRLKKDSRKGETRVKHSGRKNDNKPKNGRPLSRGFVAVRSNQIVLYCE